MRFAMTRTFALLMGIISTGRKRHRESGMNFKKQTSTFVPAMVATSAIWLILFFLAAGLSWGDDSSRALTLIVCRAGHVLGIPVGMLASPYESEGGHFQKLGGLIASFFSGFVLSQFVELKEKISPTADLALGRILLFCAFFVLSAVQTFVFRRYSDITREKDVYSADNPMSNHVENSIDS